MDIIEIKDFPRYFVSKRGNVYSHHSKNMIELKRCPTKDGYLRVCLWKNGKGVCKTIHRLVAEAFIPNPENKPQINHKNGNKKDNRVQNLEWSTQSENQLHKYRILGFKGAAFRKFGKDNPSSKIVIQLNDNGDIIAEFYGGAEAYRKTGINPRHICDCCKGRAKTAGGYRWKYKN